MSTLIDLRTVEFEQVAAYFGPGCRVLEIGGGNGYQASCIAATGAHVESIDVQPCKGATYFPVRLYDGKALPFADASFDLVFSSNVLEHIPDLALTLREIRRVLAADGRAVHVLPTPAWRGWTSVSHYPHMLRRIWQWVTARTAGQGPVQNSSSEGRARSPWERLRRLLADGPHGEYPSALSELWYFSRRRWLDVFAKAGFVVSEDRCGGLFYTGYAVCPALSITSRRRLARCLGSATRIFVMHRAP